MTLTNRIQDRFLPKILRYRFQKAARRANIHKPHFILSFDCDTTEDAAVIEYVHFKLKRIGISPIYAAPAEIIAENDRVYSVLRDDGCHFLNHGYYKHSQYLPQKNDYKSWNFYDQLSDEKIMEDIRKGHEYLTGFLGRAPVGFRTPHFGSFQTREQLHKLHQFLHSLGYLFSSSTVPMRALEYSACYQSENLFEIPVSGGYDFPLTILDSYSFRFSKENKFSEQDYIKQLDRYTHWFRTKAPSYLLNLYADPSQVHDWDAFFEAIKKLAPFNVPSYEALLNQR